MDLKGAWVIARGENKVGANGFGIISSFHGDNVEVIWNNGNTEVYAIDNNDLLVYDLAPAGTCQTGVRCDGCNMYPIYGMRWKCANCSDFDLCSMCYHGNQHDLQHQFNLICLPDSKPVNCGTRNGIGRRQISGFFTGAKVKRGKHWEWGAQDGGVGRIGKVLSLYDWTGPSERKCPHSGVSILWDQQGNENHYRIGFNGMMDLICVSPAIGGHCYTKHLPTLGMIIKSRRQQVVGERFNVGDIVTIYKSLETLMQLQEGHGGFVRSMVEVSSFSASKILCVQFYDPQEKGDFQDVDGKVQVIGKVGHVVEVLPTRDVVVMFGSTNAGDPLHDLFSLLLTGGGPGLQQRQQRKRYCLNFQAVKKIDRWVVNDKVKVIDDQRLLVLMERNIGVNAENIHLLCGEEGIVIKPFDGESIDVKFTGGDRQLIVPMSPAAIVKPVQVTHEQIMDLLLRAFTEHAQEEREATRAAATADEKPAPPPPKRLEDLNVVTEAFEGNLENVKKIITAKPYMVNAFRNGKNALHVACIQQNSDLIELLMNLGADTSLQTDDGDTVLHFAANSGDNVNGRKFIRTRCPVDLKNKRGLTALHIAVEGQHEHFVRMIVSHKCDPNIKDNKGDSSLHIACDKGDHIIVEILLSAVTPPCDVTMTNQQGLNPLHLAVHKDNLKMLVALMGENPEAINIPKPDGSTPLHIAAQNGYKDIASFLFDFYKAGGLNVDAKTQGGFSPLHVACIEGFLDIIKLFLENGLNLNEATPDGNTALHLCIRKHLLLCTLPEQLQEWELYPDIQTVKSHFNNRQASGIVVACFLIENGASIDYINGQGENVIDICTNDNLRKLLFEFAKKNHGLQETSDTVQPTRSPTRHVLSPQASIPEEPEKNCPLCKASTPIEARFQPCGHACFCYDHAECVRTCPECKTAVDKITRLSVERLPNCIICRDVRVNITFQPCGHQLSCYECAQRFKKCLTCDANIAAKVPINDIPVQEQQAVNNNSDSNNVNDNEVNLCNICFERRRNSSFLCGHGACKTCAYVLPRCHICNKDIQQIIPFFEN